MRMRYVEPKGRMHDRIEVQLDKDEVDALAKGIEVKVKKPDSDDYTWVVIQPPASFLEMAATERKATGKVRSRKS